MIITKHFAETNKNHALYYMRYWNKNDKNKRYFLLKEKINICFSDEIKNGFVLASINI